MTGAFFQKYKYLYITLFLWLMGGLFWVLFTQRADAILILNQYYNSISLPFFRFMTRMAEWVGFTVPLLFLVIFKSYRHQLGFVMVGLLTLALVTFFKEVVYHDAIRPIVYLENMGIPLPNHPEITLNRKHSFPSGHTTAGFAYFFFVALSAEKKFFSFLFLIIAMLIGLSRVFLAQHFVIDVVAGSTLGVFIATTVYYFWIFRNSSKNKGIDKKLFHV